MSKKPKCNTDMRIFAVKPDDDVVQVKRAIPEPLQKPPFIYVFQGSRGSGKGVCLANLLCRPLFYGPTKKEQVFDDIILISSTVGYDVTGRHWVDLCSKTYDYYDDSIIQNIIDSQKEKEKKDRKHILIIADDIVTIIKGRDALLFKLTSNHRHYLISICFLVQGPRILTPIVRNNATAFFLFRCPCESEMLKSAEDLSFFGGKKNMMKLYEYATSEPFEFLYLDALKFTAYKWGAKTEPKFLWSRYDENGHFTQPFNPSNIKSIKNDDSSSEESDDE